MPSKPKRRCRAGGCPVLIEGGGLCDKHRAEQQRRFDQQFRDRDAKAIYNSIEWKRHTRPFIIARDPVCKVCNTALAEHVDHIVPLAEAPDRAFDPGNLQGICKRCHSSKTAKETKAKGRW